jgi:hypothetical protein
MMLCFVMRASFTRGGETKIEKKHWPPINADKNYVLLIGVYPRSSAAQNTFCVGWQPTSDARPAWRTRRQD